MVSWLLPTVLWMAPVAEAQPTTVAEVVALPWQGTGKQYAEFIEGNYLYVRYYLNMTMDGNHQIQGTARMEFPLDGSTYNARFSVSGTYDPVAQTMSYSARLTGNDPLPNGMNFCDSQYGTLGFFGDANRAGHYILKGTVSSSCSPALELELSDP